MVKVEVAKEGIFEDVCEKVTVQEKKEKNLKEEQRKKKRTTTTGCVGFLQFAQQNMQATRGRKRVRGDGGHKRNSLCGGGRGAQRGHAALPVVVVQFGRGRQRVAHLLHLVVRRLRFGFLFAERLLEGAAQLRDTKHTEREMCECSMRRPRDCSFRK